MKEYMLIANITAEHDVYNTLRNLGKITWLHEYCPKDIEEGDIAYIYETTPINAIRWKCRVTRTQVDEEIPGEYQYSISGKTYSGTAVELEGVCEYLFWNQLSLKKLNEKNGKNVNVRRASLLRPELAKYLHKVDLQQASEEGLEKLFSETTLAELRMLAKTHSQEHPVPHTQNVKQYGRSPLVADYAKRRANQCCELCKEKAPFFDKQGHPFLEVHHVQWLSEGGADSIYNTVALCPNCHRKMHIVQDQADITFLQAILKSEK